MINRVSRMKRRVCVFLLLSCMLIGGCFDSPGPAKKAESNPVELSIYQIEGPATLGYDYFQPAMHELNLTRKSGNYLASGLIWHYLNASAFDILLEKNRQRYSIDLNEDLFITFPGSIPYLTRRGKLLELSDLIKFNELPLGQFDPNLLEHIRKYGGESAKLYALPFQRTMPVLLFNKDIFNQCVIENPRNGMTWDEVISLSRKLSACDKTIQGMDFSGFDLMLPPTQLGLTVLDPKTEEPLIDTQKWVKMVEFYRRLFSDQEVGSSRTKIAMVASATRIPSTIVDNPDKWGVVSYPAFQEAPGIGPASTELVIAINANSKKQNEAFKLATYLTSAKFQQSFDTGKAQVIYGTALSSPELRKQDGKHYFSDSDLQALHVNRPAAIPDISPYEGYANGEAQSLLKRQGIITNDKPLQPQLAAIKEQLRAYVVSVKNEEAKISAK